MPQPVFTYTTTVANILTSVSTDIRSQLSATADSSILTDWVDRACKEILRKTRWVFLLSDFKRFVTDTGVNNYWLGTTGLVPANSYAVDTGLNLTDLRKIKADSVRDRSNFVRLIETPNAPLASNSQYADSMPRLGRPGQYQQNQTNPSILTIWPAPDNQNNYSPVPAAPILKAISQANTLGNRTYRVCVTWVDSKGGESAPSYPTQIFLTNNTILGVQSPNPPLTSATGVQYNNFNVYAKLDTDPGEFNPNTSDLILQTGPAPVLGLWNENPTTGLVTSGNPPPTASTVEPIDGYVIEFQYYKQRIPLTSTAQTLQVPDDYRDVVVSGVVAYAMKYLGREQDAMLAYQKFRDGIQQIIADLNWQGDAPDYIAPDGASVTTFNPGLDTDTFF